MVDFYFKVTTPLKNKSAGFCQSKSKILTHDDVDKFLIEAADGLKLLIKVVTIIEVTGACRRKNSKNKIPCPFLRSQTQNLSQ